MFFGLRGLAIHLLCIQFQHSYRQRKQARSSLTSTKLWHWSMRNTSLWLKSRRYSVASTCCSSIIITRCNGKHVGIKRSSSIIENFVPGVAKHCVSQKMSGNRKYARMGRAYSLFDVSYLFQKFCEPHPTSATTARVFSATSAAWKSFSTTEIYFPMLFACEQRSEVR